AQEADFGLHEMSDELQLPAIAVGAAEEGIGIGVIELHFFRVPVEAGGDALGDGAEEDGFGEGVDAFEAGAGGFAALAGADPLVEFADGSGKGFGRGLEFAHADIGNEAWVIATEAGEDFTAVTDEEESFFG
ncbi:MAG: hypothetical protein RI897_3093, partial [Verrucomicrobiota bacterium]